MLLVLLLPALSIAKQCIGLTIEGGGCKGAYSAAVIKAMTDYLPAADLEYNIITGVSAGALNTGAYSQFSIGDEAKMADFALGIWESVKGPGDIFEPWPLWPPVDVFFQRPALFSTEPLRRLINNHVFGDIKRPVTVGTTNIDKGEFVVIDNEVGMEKFQEAMLCSSSFPVAFPHQSYDFYGTGKNTTYADGCVTINLDVATPINWCLKNGYQKNEIVVDILFDSNIADYDDDFEAKTVTDVITQVNELKSHYDGYNYASFVMNAFPEVNFRYIIIPRKVLTPSGLITKEAISYLIGVGTEDGTFYAQQGPSSDMRKKIGDISVESKRIVHADQFQLVENIKMWGLLIVIGVYSQNCMDQIQKEFEQVIDFLQGEKGSIDLGVQFVHSGKGPNDLGSEPSCRAAENSKYFTIYTTGKRHNTYLGLCLPDVCTEEEVKYGIRNFMVQGRMLQATDDNFEVSEVYSADFGFGAWFSLLLIIFIIGLVISGTYLHSRFPDGDDQEKALLPSDQLNQFPEYDQMSLTSKILLQFSFDKNYKEMFVSKGQLENTKIFDGVKVLTFIWAILGMNALNRYNGVMFNRAQIEDRFGSNWTTALAYGAIFSVDTFLFVSGFLATYTFQEKYEKNHGRLGFCWAIAKKLIKIIPVYFFVLVIATNFIPAITDGPLWIRYKERIVDPCSNYWWSNLLFLNNLVPDWQGNECLFGSQYLALEFQLFLIVPIFVTAYYIFGYKITYLSILGVNVLSIIICTSIASSYNLGINIFGGQDQFDLLFNKPYIRAPAFLWGIITALVYFEKQNNRHGDVFALLMGYLVETRKNSAIVMTIGVGLSTFNVFIQKNSYNAQNHDGGAMEIFYLTFCFTLQGLALFLIFIPMLIGKIKFSFRLLQLNLFTPFANLVFSSFLALTCMMVCISSLDLYSYYWSTSEQFFDFVFYLSFSFMCGYVLYMFITAPMKGISKLLITKLAN